MVILITGGLGYIGSHMAVELLNAGDEVIVVDNLSNSRYEVFNKLTKITGRKAKFYQVNIRDEKGMEDIFKENAIDAVIHFAGYKSVGESVAFPLLYYNNNITGTLILCELMKKYNCKKLIFSSSATVYGNHNTVPFKEEMSLEAVNPYGRTKLMIENILRDLSNSDDAWHIILLRYFNPIGAHESGLIGEKPKGIPNNLLPYIMQVAAGKFKQVNIYGNDYKTPDGTAIRDYIHVTDLVKGHLCALKCLERGYGIEAVNLGTGKGYSVLEVVKTFEQVNEVKINYQFAPRRLGDIAVSYACTKKAKTILGWSASKGLDEMCKDSWRFAKKLYVSF